MHQLSQRRSCHGANESFVESVMAYLLRTDESTTLLVKVIRHTSFLLKQVPKVSSMNATHTSTPEMVTLAFTPDQMHQSHEHTEALSSLNVGRAMCTVSNGADHHKSPRAHGQQDDQHTVTMWFEQSQVLSPNLSHF